MEFYRLSLNYSYLRDSEEKAFLLDNVNICLKKMGNENLRILIYFTWHNKLMFTFSSFEMKIEYVEKVNGTTVLRFISHR